jgi:hypothetical protein
VKVFTRIIAFVHCARFEKANELRLVVSEADYNLILDVRIYRCMGHLTKSSYGHHIGKGCGLGISIPPSGFNQGVKQPQRNVWKSRKWTSKEAEAEQKRAYRERLVLNAYEKVKVFDALDYSGLMLSEIDTILEMR